MPPVLLCGHERADTNSAFYPFAAVRLTLRAGGSRHSECVEHPTWTGEILVRVRTLTSGVVVVLDVASAVPDVEQKGERNYNTTPQGRPISHEDINAPGDEQDCADTEPFAVTDHPPQVGSRSRIQTAHCRRVGHWVLRDRPG